MSCKIDGCGKKVHGFGYCKPHWRKNKLYGDPLYGSFWGDGEAFISELLSKKEYPVECITWPFGRSKNGTGIGDVARGKRYACVGDRL